MSEKSSRSKKKDNDQDRVINIGDISSISGGNVNIGGGDIRQDFRQGGRTIDTGGGSYIEGNVNTGGGDFVGRDKVTIGAGMDEVARLFEQIFQAIEARPATSREDKEDLRTTVKEVQDEAAKGDQVNESFLARQLRNLGRMAPDILEVVLATLTNPAAGISTAVRKIAEKMKATSSSG